MNELYNFVEKNNTNIIYSLNELVKTYPIKKNHSIAMPVVFGYYKLLENLKEKKVILLKGLIIIQKQQNKGFKFIYYDDNYEYDFSCFKKIKVDIYYDKDIKIKNFNKSKMEEIIYNLDEIFDPSNYKNQKQRYKKLTRPLNLKNHNVFEINSDNLKIVKEIHKKWVNYKIEDVRTFKMTFSGRTYLDVSENYIKDYKLFFKAQNQFTIVDKIPFGVETNYIQDDVAYCMTSYSLWWIFKEDTMGMKMKALKELHDKGIKYFNYGLSFNKYLKEHKELILNKKVYCYRYKNY